MTDGYHTGESHDIISRCVPFYVRSLAWRVGNRKLDPRLGSALASVALYALGIAMAWITGNLVQVLSLWLFHASILLFFVGTFLLADAYHRTCRLLGSLLALCPTQDGIEFISRGFHRMYCSKWQYVTCMIGALGLPAWFILLGGTEVPFTLPYVVYVCIGGGVIAFFIFSGIWLAVTSAAFVIALSKRRDVRLLPVWPATTTALRNISSWIGTMSIYFAIEVVLLLGVAITHECPGQYVYGAFITSLVSAAIPFVTLYLVSPQFAISKMVKREKERQLNLLGNQMLHLYAPTDELPSPQQLLQYSQLMQMVSGSPNHPMSLPGILKSVASLALPLGLLYDQYREILSAIIASLQKAFP